MSRFSLETNESRNSAHPQCGPFWISSSRPSLLGESRGPGSVSQRFVFCVGMQICFSNCVNTTYLGLSCILNLVVKATGTLWEQLPLLPIMLFIFSMLSLRCYMNASCRSHDLVSECDAHRNPVTVSGSLEFRKEYFKILQACSSRIYVF